jgi:hypothetical protein
MNELLLNSIEKLCSWLIKNDYKGYEPFDGLSSYLRILTFKIWFAERVLQNLILRCPFHVRPLLGIKQLKSTKGMAFLARGFTRMWNSSNGITWQKRATNCLNWLIDNISSGYREACWGNHFDYASRSFQLPKFTPTLVWTSLIGQAFIDGYESFKQERYLDIARSACNFIIKDLPREQYARGICISYSPIKKSLIHNANMLGAALLSRTYKITKEKELADLARNAIIYSCNCQHTDGSWYYGEDKTYNWIDNWHTAYNLDSLLWYIISAGDKKFLQNLERGFVFYKKNFFKDDGRPKYYFNKLYPIDIQCAAQSIDTLCFFSDYDKEALSLAVKVANWTINNMQDERGYFYYRKLKWKKIKIPMLHWGQATMFSALAHLYSRLSTSS